MYSRSQERHRNREATVYLPALGGDGPRLDRTVRIYKCSQASNGKLSRPVLRGLGASDGARLLDKVESPVREARSSKWNGDGIGVQARAQLSVHCCHHQD